MSEPRNDIVVEENSILGAILVRNQLITREQLTQALDIYRRPENRLRLGEVMVARGFVTKEVVERALNSRDRYLADLRRRQAAGATDSAMIRAGERKDKNDAKALLQWLTEALKNQISDLHVKTGQPLIARLHGNLIRVKSPTLDGPTAERVLTSILTEAQKEELAARHSVSLCLNLPGGGRARGSIFRHFRGMDGSFRLIPASPPTLASLNLPTMLAKFTTYAQGLVLVTGPAGSGKSTTLAALVDIINRERSCHILTVEDPIEFVHISRYSLVTERQVGEHTLRFSSALRAALREDPDVIVVGEMHDTETAQLTISAAETGHLVFATLHTRNTVRSINRVIDMFPPDEQPQVRSMLAESLRGIISQRLAPREDGAGRVPVVEVMFNNTAIANLIRERKTHQLPNMLQLSKQQGNMTFADSAAVLHRQGVIAKEVFAGFTAE